MSTRRHGGWATNEPGLLARVVHVPCWAAPRRHAFGPAVVDSGVPATAHRRTEPARTPLYEPLCNTCCVAIELAHPAPPRFADASRMAACRVSHPHVAVHGPRGRLA